MDSKTTYEAGEPFEFELVLLGTAVNYLPYFVLAFREVVSGGFGLNRARCELTEVRARLSPETLVYSSADQVFHQPPVMMLEDYVNARLALFPVTCSLSPAFPLVARHSSLVTVLFLSPTFLRAGGQLIREPEFHHLFKRLRDRLNALSTFYGPGPIDADFKALGELAEKVRTVKRDVHWVERYRTSSKTHQRHELSGFIGSCVFDFAGVYCPPSSGGGLRTENQISTETEPHSQEGARDLQSGFFNLNVFSLLPWLLAGEICHVGKHAAWGNGRVEIGQL